MKAIEHIVAQGDTLYSISTKYFGDISNALTIAVINELDYPFIDTNLDSKYDSETKVARMGDVLIVPIELQASDAIEDIGEENSFGIDLVLTTNKFAISFGQHGEFMHKQGDLRVTTGRETLVQDLIHRLMTEKGTLLLHPGYGSDLPLMIGEKMYAGWEQKVIVEITKTFLSDVRVESVENVSFQKFETGIHVWARLITPLGLIDFSEYLGGLV